MAIFKHTEMKYVVLQINGINGKKQIYTAYCPVLSHDHILHSDIVMREVDKHPGVTIVHGGGRIFVDTEKKQILVFACSGTYGKALHQDVEPLFKKAMANEKFNGVPLTDFTLKIHDTTK
ncbi:MAG: hypothetical protein HY602_00660 [Parcubacteria group bacterium]|nr:hypothetical protein [Parcubacteria group bacterium]